MKKWIAVLALLFPVCAWTQTGGMTNFCVSGAVQSLTSGLPSSNYLQGVIPECTVSVYLTGTTNLATIYKDALNTHLDNPFQASANGQWLFYAAENQGYDVIGSGGNSPNTYPAPVPLCIDCFPGMLTLGVTAIIPGTNVSCTPLVGGMCVGPVTVNSATVYPAAGLAATNGISGPWRTPLYTDVTILWASGLCSGWLKSDGTCSQPTTFEHNSTALTDQILLNFLDSPPSLPSGYTPVTWSSNSGGGFGGWVPPINVGSGVSMLLTPPAAGQYVIIYPTAVATTQGNSMTSTATTTSGQILSAPYCAFGGDGTITWSAPALPNYVTAANVTAVYAFAVSENGSGAVPTGLCITAPYTTNIATVIGFQATGTGSPAAVLTPPSFGHVWTLQQSTAQLTGMTGANIPSIATAIHMGVGGDFMGATYTNIPLVGYFVYYTGTAPTASTATNVSPPLEYNPTTNTLSISPQGQFPGTALVPTTINALPIVASASGWMVPITNGANTADCTTGGGSTYVRCLSNGSAWAAESTGTKFTVSGCSAGTTVGNKTSGTFALGSASCTAVVTLNGATGLTAPNGWTCQAHDRTAPTVLIGGESSSTTATASFTIPGGAGTSDVISFSCLPY